MKLHYRVSRWFLLALARVLWGYGRIGAENIPATGPVMIACNHVSNWDPILVGLGCEREIHFVAKQELFRSRFLAWLIRAFNALPVRRGVLDRTALREAARILQNGEVLLIFPGGGRNASGEVTDPKSGVGFIACMNETPVVPAYISGSNALADAFLRRRRLRVAFDPAIEATKAASADDYRELSQRVAKAIGELRREVEGA